MTRALTNAQRHVFSIAPDAEKRERDDFYKTPAHGTRRLLAVEKFDGPVWDCACGDGAIGKVLEEHGYAVMSSDLVDRGYGAGGTDFLTTRVKPKNFRSIVTNPPFKLSREFMRRALDYDPRKIAFLMRFLLLEGRGNRPLFDRGLARVWVFSPRINIPRMIQVDGEWRPDLGPEATFKWNSSGAGGMVAFAWFVWERGHKGPPALGWI